MSDPRTAAGRALLVYEEGDDSHDIRGMLGRHWTMGAAILAVEQEAAALDVERLTRVLGYIHGDIVPIPRRPTAREYAEFIVEQDRVLREYAIANGNGRVPPAGVAK